MFRWFCAPWTHPQGFYDQVSSLQLSLHDAQQGEQLWLAQVIHVELTFLQHNQKETQELDGKTRFSMLVYVMLL